MKKAIALAVAAVAATSGAHAAWISGASGTEGEMVLTVWDVAQNKAFSQDLGINTADMLAGDYASGVSFNIDAGGIAFLGSSANIQWNVAGADESYARYDGPANSANIGIIMTNSGAAPQPQNPLIPGGTMFSNLDMFFGTYDQKIFAGKTDVNPVVTSSGFLANAGGGNIWGNAMGGLISITGMTGTAGANGDTLGTAIFTGDANLAPVMKSGGSWTLAIDQAAGTGTLTYSEVPVPAAAWLFGSALVGLASVARRRKS